MGRYVCIHVVSIKKWWQIHTKSGWFQEVTVQLVNGVVMKIDTRSLYM